MWLRSLGNGSLKDRDAAGPPFNSMRRGPRISSRSAQTRQACGVWRASPPLGRLFCCCCLATTSGHSCSQEKQPKKVCMWFDFARFPKIVWRAQTKRVDFIPLGTQQQLHRSARSRLNGTVRLFSQQATVGFPPPLCMCVSLSSQSGVADTHKVILAASEACVRSARSPRNDSSEPL